MILIFHFPVFKVVNCCIDASLVPRQTYLSWKYCESRNDFGNSILVAAFFAWWVQLIFIFFSLVQMRTFHVQNQICQVS